MNFGVGGTNNATLLADVAGRTMNVSGTNWTNPATLRVQNGATMTLSGFTANAGLIDIGVTSTLSTSNTNLTNTGVIEGSGTLVLDTSGPVETLVNRGTLRMGGAAPGYLSIRGGLTLDTGAIVEIDVQNRSGRGVGHDSLNLTGPLTLNGGQVRITHRDGFAPTALELFHLVSASSVVGSTAAVGLSGDNAGYALTAQGSQVFLTRGDPGTINVWNIDTDGFWSTAGNWSLGRAPVATDFVLIDRGPLNPTVIISSGSHNAGRMVVLETLSMSGGTLTVANASTIAGTLNWSGGTLAGAGQVSLLGPATWTGGQLDGNLRVADGATFAWAGTGDGAKDFGNGTLVNDGTITWTQGHVEIVGNGTFVNNGLFDIQAALNLGDRSFGLGTVAFTNTASGVVRAAAPSGPVTLGSLGIPGGTANYLDFTNAGRIDVVSGTLQINTGFSGATGGGTFTSTGVIDVASGATVQFGGQASLGSSGTLSGAGALLTSLGANLVSDGIMSLGGTVTVAAGTATFNSALAPSTLAVTGGTALVNGRATPGALTVTGGSATFNGELVASAIAASGGIANFNGGTVADTISITAGTVAFNNTSSTDALTLSGGTLGGTGVLTLNGPSTWSGGTLAGNLRVAAGQTLSLSGARKSFGAGSITNDGTIVSSHTALAIIDIVGDGTVNNNGLFDVQSDLFLGDQGTSLGTLTFLNATTGELRVSGGTTSTVGSEGVAGGTENHVLFTNAGTIDVRSGLLQVNVGLNGGAEGGTFENRGTGEILVGGGATMRIGGALAANAGRIEVAETGTFRKLGGFTNATTGLLSGSGTFDVGAGNVLTNQGTLLEAGRIEHMRITGNLALASTSVVNVDVGGATAGTEFDWIDVTGTATVGGTVRATLTNGFAPTDSGTRFPFVTGTSVGGTFTTTDLPANFAMVYPGASAGLEFSATGGITCSGTICWDGGAGTNLWTDAANWTSDRLPIAGDIVVINLGGTNSVLLNSGDHTVGSITVTDPFEISSASLVVDGPADFLNTLTISEASRLQLDGPTRIQTLTMLASTLTGAGAVRVLGAANLLSSALSGNGTLTTEGATTLTDNGVSIDGRRWINAGTVTQTGDAQVAFANGGVVENTGTWTLGGTSTLPLALLGGSGNRFLNSGQFVKSAGGESAIDIGGTFDGTAGATTRIDAGTLRVVSGGTDDGTWTVADGAVVRFDGGARTFSATSDIAGTGTVQFGLGNVTLDGNYAIAATGTTAIVGGRADFNRSTVIRFSRRFTLSSGTLGGTADLALDSGLDLGTGTITGTGSFTTADITTITGNRATLHTRRWVNTGGVTHLDAGAIVLTNGAVVENQGSWALGGDTTLAIAKGAGAGNRFVNTSTGVLAKASDGTSTIDVDGGIDNSGIVVVGLGTLDLFTTSTLRGAVLLDSAGTLAVGDGATNAGFIAGTGTIRVGNGTGTLTNSGVVAPGGPGETGQLSIQGNLVQTAAGTVQMEAAGTGVGSYDVLAVSGSATLAGTLDFVALNDFEPPIGTTLPDVIVYNTRTGAFANVTAAGLLPGTTASPTFDATSMSVAILSSIGCDVDVCWIGTTGDWAVGANWSTGVAPTASQRVRVSVAGDQVITVSSGAQAVGSITMDETLTVSAGALTLGGASSFNGVVNLAGGTLGVSGPTSIAQLNVSGGTLSIGANATASIANALNWTGGATISGPGTLALATSTTSIITGSGLHVIDGATLTNAGTVVYDIAPNAGQELVLANGARFDNLDTGTFTFRTNSTISSTGTPGTFVNAGTVMKDAGAGTSTIPGGGFAFTNVAGSRIDVRQGTLRVASLATNLGTIDTATGATFAVEAGVLDNAATGVLTGTGTIAAPGGVVNRGEVRPGTTGTPGTLTIAGNFSQAADGRLVTRIGGAATDPRDVLAVNGLVSLGGTLEAVVADPGAAAGGSFPIITCDPSDCISGQFAILQTSGTLNATQTLSASALLLGLDPESLKRWIGGSGFWDIASNWSGGVTPDADDEVRIENPGNITVTVRGGSDAALAGRLFATENIVIEGSSLTFSQASASTGSITVSGGQLNADAALDANELFVTGGTFSANAPVLVSALNQSGGSITGTGTLTIAESFAWNEGSQGGTGVTRLLNGATLTVSGDGAQIDAGRTVVVDAGATLDLREAPLGGTGRIENAGTLRLANSFLSGDLVNTGNIVVSNDSTHSDGTVYMNGGRIDVATGMTVLKDGGAFRWRSGTLAGPGAYNIAPGTTFELPGSGARVVDGTALRLASLAFDGGSLTLQNSGLLVDGSTNIGGGGVFAVNNSTVGLIGPANISNVAMNGGTMTAGSGLAASSLVQSAGTLDIAGGASITSLAMNSGTLVARSGLQVADYAQSAGLVAGRGSLVVTRSFQATAGDISGAVDGESFVFDTIDIQTGTLDALVGADMTARNTITVNTTGRLTVEDSIVRGDDITVNAGSLQVRADQREAGIIGGDAGALPARPGAVRGTVAGDVVISGGRTDSATAQIGSSVGTCELDVGGNLTITGGAGDGASAELFAARAIGSDDDPLSVGRAVALTTGTGEDAYARISVVESGGNIVLALPGAATDGFTVDGAPVAAAGVSGFFVAGTPAVLGENLTIVGRPVAAVVPAALAATAAADPILVAVLRAEATPILSAREKPQPEDDPSLSNRTLRPNGPLECR